MAETPRILSIIASRELFDKLEPLLSRDTLDVSAVTSGKSSLVLLRNLAFSLILVEHPLADLELDEVLEAIRDPNGLTASSRVMVFTRDTPRELDERLADPDLSCHSVHESAVDLLARVAGRIGVAARKASRMLVQLQVEVGPGRIRRVCQTVDISVSGMLLRTDRPLPIDTEVDIGFVLPDPDKLLRTRGRVVRHARAAGRPFGMGIEFVDLGRKELERLTAFIAERSASGTRSQPD